MGINGQKSQKLAIQGHKTRGKEVIELLEMLGGRNRYGYSGSDEFSWYFIDKGSLITGYIGTSDAHWKLTIEQFLCKYPYKVGDKVMLKERLATIESMMWHESRNCVRYLARIDAGLSEWCHVGDIRPYIEQPEEIESMYNQMKEADKHRTLIPPKKEEEETVMTREEEIHEAAKQWISNSYSGSKMQAFKAGAKWADQHPQYFRGQTDEMMERESLFCDVWYKEHKGERPTYADAIAWADSHPNGSVIHWQTGEPKNHGLYLIQSKEDGLQIAFWSVYAQNWSLYHNSEIIAWCKLNDIKPYKEDRP